MVEASEQTSLKAAERKEAEKRSGPESLVLYQAVVLKGEHELGRPATSLFWSGLAAGMAVSNSLVAEGALHQYLPDAPWRELVTGFGYSVGFLIVILGRLQLFTEHTVVAVMPAIGSPTFAMKISLRNGSGACWRIVTRSSRRCTTLRHSRPSRSSRPIATMAGGSSRSLTTARSC